MERTFMMIGVLKGDKKAKYPSTQKKHIFEIKAVHNNMGTGKTKITSHILCKNDSEAYAKALFPQRGIEVSNVTCPSCRAILKRLKTEGKK